MSFPDRRTLLCALYLLAVAVGVTACKDDGATADAASLESAVAPAHGVDPDAVAEALRAALVDVRDRFKCNRISGCPPHEVLTGFGWRATPFLVQLFQAAPPRARWRPRVLRILAEVGDPDAAALLLQALRDRSDEVRGYAIYGLHRIDERSQDAEIRRFASRTGPVVSSFARLSARWTLHARGEAGFGALFVDELRIRAGQSLASGPAAWGLHLCTLPEAPNCGEVIARAGRHPTFVVRRGALDVIEQAPGRQYVPILVGLLADPIPSLVRRARGVLVRLSARPELRSAEDWLQWFADTGGDAASASRPKAAAASK